MSEPFGPFREDCDPVERIAQLRVLRTLVHVCSTPFSIESGIVEAALLRAEHENIGGETALHLFDDLPALTRRRILSTFAYIHKPLYSSVATQPKKGTAHASME